MVTWGTPLGCCRALMTRAPKGYPSRRFPRHELPLGEAVGPTGGGAQRTGVTRPALDLRGRAPSCRQARCRAVAGGAGRLFVDQGERRKAAPRGEKDILLLSHWWLSVSLAGHSLRRRLPVSSGKGGCGDRTSPEAGGAHRTAWDARPPF